MDTIKKLCLIKTGLLFSLVLLTSCSSQQPLQSEVGNESNQPSTEYITSQQEHKNNSPGPVAQALKLQYGNWCGPGHPKDVNNAKEPIDILDSVCKKHDMCYVSKGDLNCGCDKDFADTLELGLKQQQYQGAQVAMVRSFRTYFKGSPCVGDHSSKVAPSRAVHNLIKNIGSKTMRVIDSLPFVNIDE